MAQYAIRTIIALVAFFIFIYAFPLLLSTLGIPLAANAFALVKLCAGVVALAYILWGPAVPWRG